MICNMGGGGSSLNFKVLGNCSKPSNPSENTIWIDTDEDVTGWAFSDECSFKGQITKNTISLYSRTFLRDSVEYTFFKQKTGVAAYATIPTFTVAGVVYQGVLVLSRDRDSCKVVAIRKDLSGNTLSTTEIVPYSYRLHGGKTYYYTVALTYEKTSGEAGVPTDIPANFASAYAEVADSLVPTYDAYGMVWFGVDKYSATPFNALKKNCIQVFPVTAKQFVGGGWRKVHAEVYQDGIWKEPFVYLFFNGATNSNLTGGINGTVSEGSLHFDATVNASYNNTYTTKSKVDLTNYKSVKALIRSTNTEKDVYFRLSVSDSAANGERFTSSSIVAGKYSYGSFENEVREVALDISSLSGTYYLGYAWGVNSGGSNAQIVGYIDGWWLE